MYVCLLLLLLLLLQAWEQPGTGLLLNERLINSPPQLAPPLVQALFSEISWAMEDEPTQVCL
jgi:protein BCP1